MGDLPGHPFRGNQYTHDGGEGTRGSHRDATQSLRASTDKTDAERKALDALTRAQYHADSVARSGSFVLSHGAKSDVLRAQNEIVRLANERVPRDLEKLNQAAAAAERRRDDREGARSTMPGLKTLAEREDDRRAEMRRGVSVSRGDY